MICQALESHHQGSLLLLQLKLRKTNLALEVDYAATRLINKGGIKGALLAIVMLPLSPFWFIFYIGCSLRPYVEPIAYMQYEKLFLLGGILETLYFPPLVMWRLSLVLLSPQVFFWESKEDKLKVLQELETALKDNLHGAPSEESTLLREDGCSTGSDTIRASAFDMDEWLDKTPTWDRKQRSRKQILSRHRFIFDRSKSKKSKKTASMALVEEIVQVAGNSR